MESVGICTRHTQLCHRMAGQSKASPRHHTWQNILPSWLMTRHFIPEASLLMGILDLLCSIIWRGLELKAPLVIVAPRSGSADWNTQLYCLVTHSLHTPSFQITPQNFPCQYYKLLLLQAVRASLVNQVLGSSSSRNSAICVCICCLKQDITLGKYHKQLLNLWRRCATFNKNENTSEIHHVLDMSSQNES